MLPRVHSFPFRLTDALHQHAARRLTFALDRFADHLWSVSARLCDLNGPRGGVDKACVITVRGRGFGQVRVRAVADDLYASIDQACERAGRRIARLIERRRDLRVDARRSHKHERLLDRR